MPLFLCLNVRHCTHTHTRTHTHTHTLTHTHTRTHTTNTHTPHSHTQVRRAGDHAAAPEALQALEWEVAGAALAAYARLLCVGASGMGGDGEGE